MCGKRGDEHLDCEEVTIDGKKLMVGGSSFVETTA